MTKEEAAALAQASRDDFQNGEFVGAGQKFSQIREAYPDVDLYQDPDGTIVIQSFAPHPKLVGEMVRSTVPFEG